MAYTDAWNVTDPPGGELAKNIDDHIRKLRLQIQERMNGLVVDWSADPIVPRDVIGGPVVGKKIIYDVSAFQLFGSNYIANVSLPVGANIKEIIFMLKLSAGGDNITCQLQRAAFAAANPVFASAMSVTTTSSNYTLISTGALQHTIADGFLYRLWISSLDIGRFFYGAQIRYDIENVTQTI